MNYLFQGFLMIGLTFASGPRMLGEIKVLTEASTKIKQVRKDEIHVHSGTANFSSRKSFKVTAKGISFSAKNAEFEVSVGGPVVQLSVIAGEVVAQSPHVQTFVPEIIKAKESFEYSDQEKSFSRIKREPKLKL